MVILQQDAIILSIYPYLYAARFVFGTVIAGFYQTFLSIRWHIYLSSTYIVTIVLGVLVHTFDLHVTSIIYTSIIYVHIHPAICRLMPAAALFGMLPDA